MDLTTRRRALMAKIIALVRMVVTSATGIVSFVTDIVRPVKVTCEFSPVQDLHGMPNPYPAGASVNLIPDGTDTSNGYEAGKFYRIDNTAYASTAYYTSEYFEVDPTKTYTYSTSTLSGKSPAILFYDENKTFISGINFVTGYTQTFTPPSGAKYARAPQTTDEYKATHDPYVYYQLEVGSTATAYRRYSNICPISGWTGTNIYNEETYDASATPKLTINWQTEPGTVYDGTVTLNEDGSADLIVNVWSKTFTGAEDWTLNSGTQASDGSMRFECRLSPASNWKSTTSVSAKTKSNIFLPEQSGRLYSGYPNRYAIYQYRFYLRVSGIATEADLKSFLSEHNLQVVYPITPRTYHFDNIGQLNSFLGQNNVWSDLNGDPTVTFWKHG